MILLSYFLFAWLAFLAFYAIMALISVLQMVRLGLAGTGTFLATAIFLVVVAMVLIGVSGYFLAVDWQQPVSLFSWLNGTPLSI